MKSIDDLVSDVNDAVERFSRSTASSPEVDFYIWMRQARFDAAVAHWRAAPTYNLKAHYADLARKRARTVINRIKAAQLLRRVCAEARAKK